MKLWKEIKADASKCNYCGNIVVAIEDIGGCSRGCPGNMKVIERTATSIFLNMKTGEIEYCITKEQHEEEF